MITSAIALSLLLLPAGRVSGTVLDASGNPTDAVVMVHRGSAVVAQALAKDGKFEIEGLREGAARIEAVTPHAQSEAVKVEVSEKTEVDLVLRARTRVRGWVSTTTGVAVPGASIHVVVPGFFSRAAAATRDRGTFRMTLPGTAVPMTFVVTAPRFPARIIQIPAGYSFDDPIRIVMPSVGGRLRVRFPGEGPMPWVRKSGDPVSLSLLETEPFVVTKGTFAGDVEPGEYTVCIDERCQSAVIAPSSDVLIDLR
ncbi:MAG TPA: carboxypeptidase-like regulatory domain-containing protein [Thermoanaerobaculia bacterium]|nr:carboxypeptidase-like regulatory domain-containing protein [Thermoanaerobaculia bacterium]